VLPKRFVYVMRSESTGRTYTGLTSDFAKRLAAHNAGQNVSTAKYRPWAPVTLTEFQTEASAARFERYLKSGSGRAFVRRHFTDTADSSGDPPFSRADT
jgi:putative endonuclease